MTELFNFQNTWFYFAINRIIQELYSHLLTLNHLWFSLLFIWPVFHIIIISTSKAPFNQSSGYWWGYQGFKPTELLSASPGSAYGASRRGKPYRGPPRVTLRTSFVHFENEYAQQQQLQKANKFVPVHTFQWQSKVIGPYDTPLSSLLYII